MGRNQEILSFIANKENALPGIQRAIYLDGPSASGKTERAKQFKRRFGDSSEVISTDWFMTDREKRDHSRVKNWYRLGRMRQVIEQVLFNGNVDDIILSDAYLHDSSGSANNSLVIKRQNKRLAIIEGRYSHMQLFAEDTIPSFRVIIDDDQSTRIERAMKRASQQHNRDPIEQRQLLLEVIEPDWLSYLPLIFKRADLYETVNGSGEKISTRPKDMCNLTHVWGAYAELQNTDRSIFRMIQVGPNGATSLHRHHDMHEVYYVVSETLLVKTMKDGETDITNAIYHPGDTVVVPPGLWHSASSFMGSAPVYYETVTGKLDPNDIQKKISAIPKTAPLSVFEFVK